MVVYIKDYKVVPCYVTFFHGHTSMIQFAKNANLKPLGPSQGVNWIWTKRSDHAPKSGCGDVFNIYSKRVILGIIFLMFDLLPFLPFFSVNDINFLQPPKND